MSWSSIRGPSCWSASSRLGFVHQRGRGRPPNGRSERMGIFKGMARRKFMKYAAAGAGATAANRLSVGGKAFAQDKVILPPNGKKFPDVELTYFQDSNWLHAPLWLSPIFQKDA